MKSLSSYSGTVGNAYILMLKFNLFDATSVMSVIILHYFMHTMSKH